MESTICIKPCWMLTSYGNKPSIINAQFRFRYKNPFVIPIRHSRSRHDFHPMVCITSNLNASRMKNGDDGNKARGAVGATVVMACVLGAMCLNNRFCSPALAANPYIGFGRSVERSPSLRSLSLAFLRSGNMALEALMDVKRANLDPKSLGAAEKEFLELLKGRDFDRDHLQKVARKLEMSGKEDKAVTVLRDEFRKEVGSERRYELGLMLVEMLIYQGEYRKARDELQKLHQNGLPDSRPLLYEAVTNTMLGQYEEGNKKWEEFQRLQQEGFGEEHPASGRDEESQHVIERLTYQQFKEHMNILKREIEEVRKKAR